MRLWRLVHPKQGGDPLSGEGARLYGGRWNPKGARVVYTATSPALALLEALVHMDPSNAPERMLLIELELPDSLPRREYRLSNLPVGWDRYPAPADVQAIGSQWLSDREEVALIVPSTVMAAGDERNVALHVTHPDFGHVREVSRQEVQVDPRYFENRR